MVCLRGRRAAGAPKGATHPWVLGGTPLDMELNKRRRSIAADVPVSPVPGG